MILDKHFGRVGHLDAVLSGESDPVERVLVAESLLGVSPLLNKYQEVLKVNTVKVSAVLLVQ